MGLQKLLGRLAGVIPCAIMDEKQMGGGLGEDHAQECLVTVRSEAALNALIEEAPRAISNSAKHLVAFALATGFDLGMMAAPGPRVAQRTPLGKAGLVLKENQAMTPLGSAENCRPFGLQPGLTAGGIEMIRHETRLLKRKPQVVQQCTHIVAVGGRNKQITNTNT